MTTTEWQKARLNLLRCISTLDIWKMVTLRSDLDLKLAYQHVTAALPSAELSFSLNNVTTLTIAQRKPPTEHWWSWVLMIWDKAVQSLSSAWVILGRRRGWVVNGGFITLAGRRTLRDTRLHRFRFPLKVWSRAHETISSLFQPKADSEGSLGSTSRWGALGGGVSGLFSLLFFCHKKHTHILRPGACTVNFTPAD